MYGISSDLTEAPTNTLTISRSTTTLPVASEVAQLPNTFEIFSQVGNNPYLNICRILRRRNTKFKRRNQSQWDL